MSETMRRGPYAKGVRRREEILDRTRRMLTERGASKISLRAVAEDVGISHGTLLHYFPTIEELMLEVVALNDLSSAEWLASHQQAGLAEEMIEGARHNVSTAGVIATYTAMLSVAVEETNVVSRAFFIKRFAQGRVALAKALRAGRPDLTDDRQAEALANLIMAAFDGLQTQWLLDPEVDLAGSMAMLKPLLGDAPATYAAFQELTLDLWRTIRQETTTAG
ncbi:TetR/AcrR family transcriptional regulator [Amycolatopsis sp. NPDC049691]|uniref:TetR/AcrR family transcriptional regulator n=1 Tax=Amycolatopsis sp. NPDC049691 TaxID=3155155 RepID=UPI0034239BE8